MFCPACGYMMGDFDTECLRCHRKGLSAPPTATPAGATYSQVPLISQEWHYSHQGKRVGPVRYEDVQRLVSSGAITGQTLVWRSGMPDWAPAHQTDLTSLFFTSQLAPPPLMGEEVNNSLVWVIAFAPLISVFIEACLGAAFETPANNFWWIAILLNICLCVADEQQLKNAGHDTDGMGVWAVLLVPVYLFVRAAKLKQNNSYAVVWLFTFFFSLLL